MSKGFPRHLKRRLILKEEKSVYRKLFRGGIPVIIVLVVQLVILVGGRFTTYIKAVGWYLSIYAVAIFIFCVAVYVRICWIYLRRLKGKRLEEFLTLYRQMVKHSKIDDAVNKVLLIVCLKKMAALSDSSWVDVHEVTFQRAGTVLGPIPGLPIRIPPLGTCSAVLEVLNKDLEELPPYLSHQYEYVRAAAVYRCKLLGVI